MVQIQKDFPTLAHCTYLNTAANGLIAKPVLEWRRRHDLLLLNNGESLRAEHRYLLEDVRKKLGNFFGASAQEIALVPNFSLAINMVLESLPEGQKILLLNHDYPSVNWPVEHRDFNVCYAAIDEHLEQNIEDAIEMHRPDILILSLVQWLNGVKIDLEYLKRIKQNYPNLLLIADGTQYLGTENFVFADSAIDVLAASFYKWLTAGFGNGFLAIKKSVMNSIFPKAIGFNSAETFDSDADSTAFMKHFEPGHLDTLSFGSVAQAIEYFENHNPTKIYQHIALLAKKAKKEFTDLGLLRSDTLNRSNHSSIFNIKGDQELMNKLKERNIIVSPRGGGIRVSFHFYNSEEDLERFLEVVR